MSNPFIFLSYSRSDSDLATKITRDIQNCGGNIWMDQLHISGGDRWDKAIEDAMEKSSHVIVLLSPASIDSYNVMDEVSYALEEKKNLVPLLIENCKIPFRLRRLQYLDFVKDYDLGIKKLNKILGLSDSASKPSSPKVVDTEPVQSIPKPSEPAKIIEKKPSPKKVKRDPPKTVSTPGLSDAWRLYEDAKKLIEEEKFDQAIKLLKEHAKICRSKNDKESLSHNYLTQSRAYVGKGQWGMFNKFTDSQSKLDDEVRKNQEKYDEIFYKYNLISLEAPDADDSKPAQVADKPSEPEKVVEEKKDSQKTVNTQEDYDAKKLFNNAKKLIDEDQLDQALELLKEHASICKSYDDKISLKTNYELQMKIYLWEKNIELFDKYDFEVIEMEVELELALQFEDKNYHEIWETNGLT